MGGTAPTVSPRIDRAGADRGGGPVWDLGAEARADRGGAAGLPGGGQARRAHSERDGWPRAARARGYNSPKLVSRAAVSPTTDSPAMRPPPAAGPLSDQDCGRNRTAA